MRAHKVKKRFNDINDDVNIALATKADGVHLGENDMPLKRPVHFGDDFIIGISCYNSIQKH